MFGRKKDTTAPAPGAPATAGSAAPGGKDAVLAYLDRKKVDIDARFALQQRGATRLSAVVSSATITYQMPTAELGDDFALHPEQELAVQAELHGADGSTSPVHFTLYLDELLEAPAPGATVYVLVDPSDPTAVLADELWDPAMPGNQPGFGHQPIRWNVPAECPNCGARVDQSTEALAEHPTCKMCHEPLPCEPVS
jgi:hypothetical protein